MDNRLCRRKLLFDNFSGNVYNDTRINRRKNGATPYGKEDTMKKILDLITDEVTKAFMDCGYDAKYGKVTLSNRPDLCEYQCNGAMAAAKEYKKAPFMIADEVAAKLAEASMFSMAESVKPGFLNLKLDETFLASYVADMQADEGRFGCEKAQNPKTIMIDYGGPSVQNRCMSGIYVLRSSERVSKGLASLSDTR